MRRVLCQGLAGGEIGRKKQVWGPSPSCVAQGLVWDGKGCAAGESQAEGWEQLALLQKVPFWSRKHWPALEKPGIRHPLLSLTSWISLSKMLQFLTTQFSTWKKLSAWVLHSLIGVKNCPESSCDFGVGRQPALPWVCTPWGSKLAQDCRYWWAIVSGEL